MRYAVSFRILGVLLMIFSTTMLVPMAIAMVLQDGHAEDFILAFALTFLSGLLIWLPVRGERKDLRIRDGFLVTSLFWTVLGLFGSLPFAITDSLQLGAIDAIFESISGLTSTGASVIVGLDYLPKSILFYRQMLQWLGGIGIVVIAVAILPMLGVGGMQLYRTETPGPSKDTKLTPRINETAKALFLVYLVLTILCALSYYLAGMSAFDAIGHSFSTVSLAGFSTHDASLSYYNTNSVLLVAIVFMLIASLNFGFHFLAWRRKSLAVYVRDPETKFYLAAVSIPIIFTAAYLYWQEIHGHPEHIIQGAFQVISIITTTGYTTDTISYWHPGLAIMAIFFSCMGGCVGSTTGGMKTMRVMLIYKQGFRELRQLVHPHAMIPLKVGKHRVDASIISAVWSFIAIYSFTYIILLLVLVATGEDFLTAFSAVAAALNNLGMGIADVAGGFSGLTDVAKVTLCAAMLLGRLEIFTLLVLFTPGFWRT